MRKEERGRNKIMGWGGRFDTAEASPFLPRWKVEWYRVVALSWGSQGVACGCPYYWPLTTRSIPFPLAKVPKILGISGKCSQPEHDQLEKHSWPQSSEFGLSKRTPLEARIYGGWEGVGVAWQQTKDFSNSFKNKGPPARRSPHAIRVHLWKVGKGGRIVKRERGGRRTPGHWGKRNGSSSATTGRREVRSRVLPLNTDCCEVSLGIKWEGQTHPNIVKPVCGRDGIHFQVSSL